MVVSVIRELTSKRKEPDFDKEQRERVIEKRGRRKCICEGRGLRDGHLLGVPRSGMCLDDGMSAARNIGRQSDGKTH